MTASSDNSETGFHLLGLPATDESHELRAREPFEVLVSQFVAELRAGSKPSTELYARRFPRHADRIREVFPVLSMLEQSRIQRETTSIRQNMPGRFPFTRLGQCELLGELGRGGMGVVYKARDLTTQELVAVKILPWRTSVVPEQVERFEQEARIAAGLRHPNIVPVYRYGQENGYCFFVMQYVRGIGLDRIIDLLQAVGSLTFHDEIERLEAARNRESSHHSIPAAHRSPPATAAAAVTAGRLAADSYSSMARIVMQAAQALSAAHSAKILHNDIKPGNLLLDEFGHVWVTDFGLSQPAGDNATSTAGTVLPGSVAGTLRYMAPERLSGKQGEACDIYALGATFYELACQQPLFPDADRSELIRRIRSERPAMLSRRDGPLPVALRTLLNNCLARDPRDRYRDADQLLVDLQRFLQGRTIRSRRRPFWKRWVSGLRGGLVASPGAK
jgi:serine/threonine protein kinase